MAWHTYAYIILVKVMPVITLELEDPSIYTSLQELYIFLLVSIFVLIQHLL